MHWLELQKQNISAAPGKVGEGSGQMNNQLQYVIKYGGKFFEPKQYEEIPLRANSDGTILRLKDISVIEFAKPAEGTAVAENEAVLNLSLANTRARLRMTTLYYFAGLHGFLVAGTGNKVEDFGIGFYTKYGD